MAIFAIASIRPLRTLAIAIAVSTALVAHHRLQENKPLLAEILPAATMAVDTVSGSDELTRLITDVAVEKNR